MIIWMLVFQNFSALVMSARAIVGSTGSSVFNKIEIQDIEIKCQVIMNRCYIYYLFIVNVIAKYKMLNKAMHIICSKLCSYKKPLS